MGYRDDLYSKDNIIGYSGKLESFPTVYFVNGQEYGHITQKHDVSQNVGRNAVGKDPEYFIGNEMVNGQMKLVEKSGDDIWHESRSTLTRVEDMDAQGIAILAQVIWKCPDEKYISYYGDDDWDKIDKAEAVKHAVNLAIKT